MRYLGGKSRISKDIATILNENNESNMFVSLFCGSCSVEAKVYSELKILNDKHKYLIAMWKALQSGYKPPDKVTSEMYKYVKEHKDENEALTGFVGFACSFGGKWFGGLARNKRGEDFCLGAEHSILKDLKGLQDAIFFCNDYKNVIIPYGALVYCDPPYANTTTYTTGEFNTKDFWEYMRKLSKTNRVFISEQEAPDDFKCVWQKDFKRMLDVNKDNIFTKTEKLFTYKD